MHEAVHDWYCSDSSSVAQLLLRELALGAHYGVVFLPELMMIARSLSGMDATTTLIAPDVPFSDLLGPATALLRSTMLPNLHELSQGALKRWFDYLDAALELPDLLPELIARLRSPTSPATPTGSGPVAARREPDVSHSPADGRCRRLRHRARRTPHASGGADLPTAAGRDR